MECSVSAKVAALRGIYSSFFEAESSEQKGLVEAFFWVTDELEDQLQAEGNLNDQTLSALQEVKAFADSAFMDPQQWVGRDNFIQLIADLRRRIARADDAAW